VALTKEQWREKIDRLYAEERLDGAPPLDVPEVQQDNATPTHRLRLDMNGATPPSEVDVEESARRAAAWLNGEGSS
jgi:hypothetical protein